MQNTVVRESQHIAHQLYSLNLKSAEVILQKCCASSNTVRLTATLSDVVSKLENTSKTK